MTPIITTEIVLAFGHCHRKAYLLLHNTSTKKPHEYLQILEEKRFASQTQYLTELTNNKSHIQPYTLESIKNNYSYLTNATLGNAGFEADCSLLVKASSHPSFYEPTIFIGIHKINEGDKLHLSYVGHVLGQLQGKSPSTGYIIDVGGKLHAIKLHSGEQILKRVLESLSQWLVNEAPKEPSVILNKHCPLCQFRDACHVKAEHEDSLSLLDKATSKIILQYEKKGIFTVKQLGYTFKPRKQKKRSKKTPPITHNLELQALAIREGKIYLHEAPNVTRQSIELFLDIEGIPDQDVYYLFGLLVCEGDQHTYHAFWGDMLEDEDKIWQQLLEKLNKYPDAPIYHYGNYEAIALQKLARRYNIDGEPFRKRLINVNSHIYGKVYFPVYSNSLKDVGKFIGAKWSSQDASGLQSLVWRHHWDKTYQFHYQTLLLIYNEEDCHALRLLVHELARIKHSADTLSEVNYANQHKQLMSEAGGEIHSQFKKILEFAHFAYDDKKIQFKIESNEKRKGNKPEAQRQKAEKQHEKLMKIKSGAKKIVAVPPDETCPICSSKLLKQTQSMSQRYIIDLVLTKDGIKKTITQYVGTKVYCTKCQKYYAPARIRQFTTNQIYGHGFGAWIIIDPNN